MRLCFTTIPTKCVSGKKQDTEREKNNIKNLCILVDYSGMYTYTLTLHTTP